MHFSSDPNQNILDYFNKYQQREFYSVVDYEKFGGRPQEKEEDDEVARQIKQKDQTFLHSETRTKVTSTMGTLI